MTTAHIDLAAFEHNVSKIVAEVSPASAWIAIKSNAYGHGMVELADNAISAGATGFAVLDVPAALRLRSAGVTARLFAWLHGSHTDFAAAVAADIDLGVSSLEQLRNIASVPGVGKVHLKIDTGLHRNGFDADSWQSACEEALVLEQRGEIRVTGVWSHLADAGDAADADAIARFTAAVDVAIEVGLSPEIRHIAASSAGLRNSAARFDVVRIGIAAYGISPFDDVDGRGLGFTPVMSLTSTIDSVAGERAIVASGWSDGVPQVHDSTAWVSVAGVHCPVIAVTATQTIIDTTGIYVTEGDTVTILGSDGPSAEQWASWTNTIGDEIVTNIPSHVRRVFFRP